MDNEELLQAIIGVIDMKLQPIKDDITSIKIYQENTLEQRLSSLADGHILLNNKLDRLNNEFDKLENKIEHLGYRVLALETKD